MKKFILAAILGVALVTTTSAWAQWSSNPSQNLALSDIANADQVQPKTAVLPNGSWYVSWFNNNPNDPPPNGYDVYYQMLNANGVEQFPHDGVQVAKLTLSSTQDYGLATDASGNALIAFLDDRNDSGNPQVTAVKMSPTGQPLWGMNGVRLTSDASFHGNPKIAATSDGGVVVAWISDSNVVVQKLDPSGHLLGQTATSTGQIVLSESGAFFQLSDLHASNNGSVIVSWIRQVARGNRYLYANKISQTGQLLWGASHVHVYDGGSLQNGNFPYFVPDGNGGAVFAWYSSSPSLQVFAQHILANGTEAFPHNGSAGAVNGTDVRVTPTASYDATTQEVFTFWTELDQFQTVQGISGQKFNSTGVRQWSDSGLTIVPLGNDAQINPQNVQIGSGALVFWIDQQLTENGIVYGVKLDGSGATLCSQFPVANATSQKARLWAGIAPSGLSTVAFQDYRNGNSDIFIQNVNSDCSLGQQGH